MQTKNISRLLFYVLTFFGLQIAACKKGPEKSGSSSQIKKLIRVEEDANNNSTFEYNADGTLKAMEIRW